MLARGRRPGAKEARDQRAVRARPTGMFLTRTWIQKNWATRKTLPRRANYTTYPVQNGRARCSIVEGVRSVLWVCMYPHPGPRTHHAVYCTAARMAAAVSAPPPPGCQRETPLHAQPRSPRRPLHRRIKASNGWTDQALWRHTTHKHSHTRAHPHAHSPVPPAASRLPHPSHSLHTYIYHTPYPTSYITHHTVCSCCVLLRRGAVRYCAGVILRGGP